MIEISPWMILVQLISFLVLMAILSRYLFSPLSNFIEKRRKNIQDTFSLINEEKEKASSLMESAEKRLKETENEAKRMVERAIKEGEALKTEIIKKAKEEGERISEKLITSAKEEIRREKQAAIKDISRLSIAIASKLLKESIDEKRQVALLEEFIGDIKEEIL